MALIMLFRNRNPQSHCQYQPIYLQKLIFIIVKSMKKFLHLKKSIIDSKNQPTLMQTYLDTIRSSCYKLATPHVSPQSEFQSQCLPSPTHTSNQNINLMRSEKTMEEVSYSQGEKIKKSQLKQQKNSSGSQDYVTPSKVQLTTQFSQEQPLDRVFETLQSQCKSANKWANEGQILNIILNNLQKLRKIKKYQQSVELIKGIITKIGMDDEDSQYANISNHSLMKNTGYIVPPSDRFEECENSFDDSHFNSCKYQPDQLCSQSEIPSHHGNSIYIEDPSEPECLTLQYEDRQRQTHRDSLCQIQNDSGQKYKQCSLYCIEEEQEDDMKSSVSQLSVIPEETIQFKKIIYMLESNTKKKVIPEMEVTERHSSQKNSSSCQYGSSGSSHFESLILESGMAHSNTNISSNTNTNTNSHIQMLDGTFTEAWQDSPAEAKPKTNTKPNKQPKTAGSHKTMTRVSIIKKNDKQPKKPQKAPITKVCNKEKSLEDIINMLSTKYNRTVKLGR